VKRPERDNDRSPPSIAQAETEWSYTCTSPIHLDAVDREIFDVYHFFFRNSDHTVLNDLMDGKNVERKDCSLIQGTNLALSEG